MKHEPIQFTAPTGRTVWLSRGLRYAAVAYGPWGDGEIVLDLWGSDSLAELLLLAVSCEPWFPAVPTEEAGIVVVDLRTGLVVT